MYNVKYSRFNKQWMVVSVITGLAQSGWGFKQQALQVAKDLNKHAKRGLI